MPRMTNSIHDHFELLNNMKMHILKAHINCQGCVEKVRKLLRKIQGVYSVNIDAEEEIITVVGNVDSATLIRRLARAGKHAYPIWSAPSPPRNHNIQTLQVVQNEQIKLHNNQSAGLDGHNDYLHHHQFGAFEDIASSIGGGSAAPMPQYFEAGHYYSPPADHQFYLQSHSNSQQF